MRTRNYKTLTFLTPTVSFLYRTHDSVQNNVQVEKFMTIFWPVRRDASFKPQLILY